MTDKERAKDWYDKHKATAFNILKAIEKEVTEEQRRLAKTINFGIVYGKHSKQAVKE